MIATDCQEQLIVALSEEVPLLRTLNLASRFCCLLLFSWMGKSCELLTTCFFSCFDKKFVYEKNLWVAPPYDRMSTAVISHIHGP